MEAAALGKVAASWPRVGKAGVVPLARFAGRLLGPAAASLLSSSSPFPSLLLIEELVDSSKISEE